VKPKVVRRNLIVERGGYLFICIYTKSRTIELNWAQIPNVEIVHFRLGFSFFLSGEEGGKASACVFKCSSGAEGFRVGWSE